MSALRLFRWRMRGVRPMTSSVGGAKGQFTRDLEALALPNSPSPPPPPPPPPVVQRAPEATRMRRSIGFMGSGFHMVLP